MSYYKRYLWESTSTPYSLNWHGKKKELDLIAKYLSKIQRYVIDFVVFKYPDITKTWVLTVNKTETKQKLIAKFS